MSVYTELKRIWKLLSESTNIPVLIVASSIGLIGIGFLLPILPIYLRDAKGISFMELGYIISISGVFIMVLKPAVGYISDKFGRKIVIASSYYLQGVVTPLYLIINSIPGLALVQSCRNAATQISQPAVSAMIGDVAPKDGRATLFGFYSSIGSFVYAIALIVGGGLLAWGFQIEHIFFITAGCLLVSAAVLALFLKETVKTEKPAPSEVGLEESVSRFKTFVASIKIMVADRNSLGLLLYSFFFSFSLGVYPVYISLFVKEVFGGAEELVGPITAASWISFSLIQPYGGWLSDWSGKRKILVITGFVLLIIFNTGMAVSSHLVWMVVFWTLIGVADGLSRPVMSALIVDVTPPSKRGTYFGTLGFVRGAAKIVDPLIYGFVADMYGIRWAFLITSVALTITLLAVLILIKEERVIGEE